jgi:hypothetical protein
MQLLNSLPALQAVALIAVYVNIIILVAMLLVRNVMKKLGGRKTLIALLVFFDSTVLLVTGIINTDAWVTISKWTFGFFIGGNGIELIAKAAENIKGKQNNPGEGSDIQP